MERAKAALKAAGEKAGQVDKLSYLHDAVPTRAGIAAGKAATGIKLDLPDALDRKAAVAVVEAGGDRAKLEADLAKVQGSPDKKLAAEYAPVYRHALDNTERLRKATVGYTKQRAIQANAAQKAGVEATPWQPYVQHVLDDPGLEGSQSLVKDHGLGVVPKFKTYADAIAAGVDPKSMDLADVAERQARRTQQAINEAQFQKTAATMRAADGKPLLSKIEENSTTLNPDGSVSSSAKVPKGYEVVQAGDNVLTVHQRFAPLFKALYGESAFDTHEGLSKVKDLAALAKHGTAMLDTYHAMRVLFKEVLGFQTVGYGKGLAALDYAPEDLDRAVAAGKLSQADADFARTHGEAIERGLKAGLNVGKISDNLLENARQHGLIERLPVVGKPLAKFNELIFGKLTRGAMVQAFTVAEARNRARFKGLSDEQVARKSAKEVNEVFGNLGSQGLLKGKTMQDVAKVLLFAPNWSESQFRAEARGFAQAGKAAADFVRGQGFHPGVVAQAMAGTLFAALAANQALNMVTRGKPTWTNPEEGHQWDAWIPGGAHNKGFWFSPLSIAAEYTHAMHKYLEGGEGVLDAAAHVASNKLSGPARGVQDLVTGKDWMGQPFESTSERLKAAALDTLPSPMPLSGLLEKDPGGKAGHGPVHDVPSAVDKVLSPLGYKVNRAEGSLEKQAFGMAGLKLDNAQSARSQMYEAAQPFRGPRPTAASVPPSQYAALRTALANADQDTARQELVRLVTEGHRTIEQVAEKAVGIGQDRQVHPESFTGSHDKDKAMYAKLTPEQREVYHQAFADRVADARLFAHLVATMPPDEKRRLQIASAQNRAKAKAPGQP